MLQRIRNLKGQGVTVEYATTFAVVFVVITAMSVYFKRVVQSRFAVARDYVDHEISSVMQDTSLNLVGKFQAQYEPYYIQSEMEKLVRGTIIDREIGGVGVGSIHEKEYQGYQTTLTAVSNQLSPRDAN